MQALIRPMRTAALALLALAALPLQALADHRHDKADYHLARVEAAIDDLRYVGDPYERLDRVAYLNRKLDKISYKVDKRDSYRSTVEVIWIDALRERLYQTEERARNRLRHLHGNGYRAYDKPGHRHGWHGKHHQHGDGPDYGAVATRSFGFPLFVY